MTKQKAPNSAYDVGYQRAIQILEDDLKLRKAIDSKDPVLSGILIAIATLRMYQEVS